MSIEKSGFMLLLVLGGCGGGNGMVGMTVAGTGKALFQIGMGGCGFLTQLVAESAGTMSFTVDDTPGNSADSLEIAIVPDSALVEGTCNFADDHPIVDETFIGSAGGSISVVANTYDFLATCYNTMALGSFNLAWHVTY